MSIPFTLLLLYLLLLSINTFPAAATTDSEPMESNMEECKKWGKTFDFEEAWPLLQTAVDTLINQFEEEEVEESVPKNKSIFTADQYMSYYKTVYELCTDRLLGDRNSKLLYIQYKKVFDDYINSTVLPSLREKKDEVLLRELLRRWSNHNIMTRWLFRFFHYLDRYYIPRWKLPSLEETSFLSFYDLVFDEMHKQVTDVILAMIDQERAGEQIDRTLVNNTLAFYSEIDDRKRKYNAKNSIKENAALYYGGGASHWITTSSFFDNTPKEEKLHDSTNASSKKINLISSDGDVFEVDYEVALMSKTIEEIIKTNSVGDTDNIPVSLVSSKILAKVIEYCKKHIGEHMNDVDLKEWDAEFLEVDHYTLFDLVLSANYLNIKSLLDLTASKIGDMMKGKTPEEIRHTLTLRMTLHLQIRSLQPYSLRYRIYAKMGQRKLMYLIQNFDQKHQFWTKYTNFR